MPPTMATPPAAAKPSATHAPLSDRWKTLRAIILRIVFYLAVILVIAGVWRYVGRLTPTFFIEPAASNTIPIQQIELSTFSDMNNLLSYFCTGLLAGLGYILTSRKKVISWSGARWLALGSALCAALSLFFGYVVFEVLIGMMNSDFIDFNFRLMSYFSWAHFYSLLLAVLLFGDFAFHTFFRRDGDVPKSDPSGS
jgi:hypothetical protein